MKIFASNFATLFLTVVLFACSLNFAGAEDAWRSLRVLDANALDWDDSWAGLRGTSQGKKLFSSDSGAFMLLVEFDQGWDAVNKGRHFHDFHEWGFVLEGDFLIYEFVSPAQEKGSLYTMRPGTWMSRLPFSIHGNRADAMDWQQVTPGSRQLVFIEGGKNYVLDPEHKWYRPDWQNITAFTQPRFQNTALPGVMEWEQSVELPGAKVKWLSDDIDGGFRSQLVYVPAGWSRPDGAQKSYFEKAQRFVYMLSGDLKVQVVEGPDDAGKSVTLRKDYFVEQPPKSIWGWGEGALSEKGAMWLEVTYAEGTRWGNGPIETVKAAD